jgi:hypothetical protein
MRQLFEDIMKVSASVKELLLLPTVRGQLHHMIRLSRPNWSNNECFKAGRWIRRNGLKARSAFSGEESHLTHINTLLQAYDKAFPVRGQLEVADELAQSRWEARWQRARARQPQSGTKKSLNAAPLSTAA